MKKISSKSGAASMFVVIFTTLLLGIISLGFINIMLSESNQTTNFDLSQSAYDSALAGIEDAKIALLKYNQCLSQGHTAGPSNDDCPRAIRLMTADYSSENCDIVQEMLGRPIDRDENGNSLGTIIQSESGSGIVEGGTEIMEQAYTCVKMEENTNDYLGTLNQNYRTKIVPIRTVESVDKVDRIRLGWYNSTDQNKVDSSGINSSFDTDLGSGTLDTNKKGYGSDAVTIYQESNAFSINPPAPPTMQFQLIQTATNFTLSQFDTNSNAASNRGTLLLRPSRVGADIVNLVRNDYNIGLAGSADRSFNNPIDIKCDMDDRSFSYRCNADIIIPRPIGGARNDGTMFVRLVLPYNTPDTSFSLELYDCTGDHTISNTAKTNECDRVQFAGVQTRVDSTGRANDLFRRVEARLEMQDIYYPFPEFAADVSGRDPESIWKSFWVTYNCWTTSPNNPGQSCPNIQRISGS